MATLTPIRIRKRREPIPAPIRGTFRKCHDHHHEPILADRNGRYIVTCDSDEQLLYRCSTAAEAVRWAQEHGDGSVFVHDRNCRSMFHLSRHQAFIRNLPFTKTLK